MIDEKKYKYCSISDYYLFDGLSNSWTKQVTIYNNQVGTLRLLGMMPSIYLYDVTAELMKNIATIVDIIYVDSPPYNSVNEYKERVVSVSGATVSYPKLSYVYPYEQRTWSYPVIMAPGSKLEFWVTVSPSQALSNVRCYLYCVFIFEDV